MYEFLISVLMLCIDTSFEKLSFWSSKIYEAQNNDKKNACKGWQQTHVDFEVMQGSDNSEMLTTPLV